jgi:polysaccharide export outer membrane protein
VDQVSFSPFSFLALLLNILEHCMKSVLKILRSGSWTAIGVPLALFLGSVACVPYQKTIYLQQRGANGKPTYLPSVYPSKAPSYRLQPGDVVGVYLSAASPDAKFNAFFTDPMAMTGSLAPTIDPVQRGYPINDSGRVFLPLLGSVMLAGLTAEQARDKLRDLAAEYVDNPVAKVTLLNFYVTLLGEFVRPGRYVVYNSQITILEALALGGDLTSTANRSQLRLSRTAEGKVSSYFIDLTDEKLLGSPFFYLLPGDVLYVEPLKAKNNQLNSTNTLGLASVLVNLIFFVTNTVILIRSSR